MDEYFKRPKDVLDAIKSLGRLGIPVSLPDFRSDGEMFFRIGGHELSVAQMLELFDKKELHAMALRESHGEKQVRAAGSGM